MTKKRIYEREIVPLIQALLEKTRQLDMPCLLAVQVEEGVRISGNLVGASLQMQEAFAILFAEDDGALNKGE